MKHILMFSGLLALYVVAKLATSHFEMSPDATFIVGYLVGLVIGMASILILYEEKE
jgi:hypothetical protein